MSMMSDKFMYTGKSNKRLHDSEDEEHEIDNSSTVVTSLQQKMKRIRRFIEKTYNNSIVNNNLENEENLGISSSLTQKFSSWRHPAQSPLNNNYQGVSKHITGQFVSSSLNHSSCECEFEQNSSCTGFTVNSSSDRKKMEEIEFCFDEIVPSPRKYSTKGTAPKLNGKVVQSIIHNIGSESNQDTNLASNSQSVLEMEAHRTQEHRGRCERAQVVLTNGWQCKNAARKSNNRSETFPWTDEQIEILDSAILSFRILPRSTVGKVFRELKNTTAKDGASYSEDHVRKWLENVNSDYSVRCRFAEREKKLLECDHARGAEPKTGRKIRFNDKVVRKIINEDG